MCCPDHGVFEILVVVLVAGWRDLCPAESTVRARRRPHPQFGSKHRCSSSTIMEASIIFVSSLICLFSIALLDTFCNFSLVKSSLQPRPVFSPMGISCQLCTRSPEKESGGSCRCHQASSIANSSQLIASRLLIGQDVSERHICPKGAANRGLMIEAYRRKGRRGIPVLQE
jgi:hypothetical protein